MLLEFQYPYKYAKDRAFPCDIAYLCFAPEETVEYPDLIDLGIELLGNEMGIKFVLVRPYKAGKCVVNAGQAKSLMSADVAEAYALVHSPYTEELWKRLESHTEDEECILVECCREDVVVFFHQGHHSIEVVGNSEQVKRRAAFLFARYIGQ